MGSGEIGVVGICGVERGWKIRKAESKPSEFLKALSLLGSRRFITTVQPWNQPTPAQRL